MTDYSKQGKETKGGEEEQGGGLLSPINRGRARGLDARATEHGTDPFPVF
jgi:hypothetical protein